MTARDVSTTRERTVLVVILVLAFALRVFLVLRGQQGFWADESRYYAAINAVTALAHGDFSGALRAVAGTADHLGFKVAMILPAGLEHLLGWGETVAGSQPIPAIFLCFFSTANVAWVWFLARRLGAPARERLWAVTAMACSCAMTYWVRHVVPYDMALCWGLAAGYVALKPQPRWIDSCLAGLLGFVAFVTYNGYWLLVACFLVAHVLRALPSWREAGRRALGGLVGLAGTFAVLLLLVRSTLHVDLLTSYVQFSGSINQGEFSDGHLVFFDYLWQAERLTAILWLGSLIAFPFLLRRGTAEDRRRGWLWVAIVVGMGLMLILGSDVLEKFVVYGRLARQVAPFCALLVGWTAERLFSAAGRVRPVEVAAFVVLVVAGGMALSVPIRQDFPVPFRVRALAVMTAYQRQHVGSEPGAVAPEKFRFLYDGFIWPNPDEKPLPPHYLVLFARSHPLAWRPYLYEGFNRAQRAQIEATDISMRLVLLQD
jgi:hypothetical protein